MKRALILAACIVSGCLTPGVAQDLKATQKFTDTQIAFDPGGSYSNYTLTITGPNGIHSSVSSKGDLPSVDLRQIGAVDDGAYNYQLTASTGEKTPVRSKLDNGRAGGPGDSVLTSVSKSGRFEVKNGAIVRYDSAAKENQRK